MNACLKRRKHNYALNARNHSHKKLFSEIEMFYYPLAALLDSVHAGWVKMALKEYLSFSVSN